jgi:hypothetical protein
VIFLAAWDFEAQFVVFKRINNHFYFFEQGL